MEEDLSNLKISGEENLDVVASEGEQEGSEESEEEEGGIEFPTVEAWQAAEAGLAWNDDPRYYSQEIGDTVTVKYSPVSGLPVEYCRFGPQFEEEIPWLMENAPEVLTEADIAAFNGTGGEKDDGSGEKEAAEGDGKKKKSKKTALEKRANKANEVPDQKIIIARIQRQKKKFITAVSGMETVPLVEKLKDVSKLFSKKFASSASVSKSATGAEEIVIQGDVQYEIPELIIKQFKVDPTAIFFLEDKSLRPFAE